MPSSKTQVSITVSDEVLDWIEKGIKTSRFANRSHAFEYAVKRLMVENE